LAGDGFGQRIAAAMRKADERLGQVQAGANAANTSNVDPNEFTRRLQETLQKARGESPTEDGPDAHSAAPANTAAQDAPAECTGPVGSGEHLVRQGECTSSIARDTGHFWETIWKDAGNTELREIRKDPNVLLPDDRVVIPEKRRKDEPIAPEKRHRFVRRGEPATIQVRLLREGRPRVNEPYVLEIDGAVHSGKTDANGNIRWAIPGNAREARLIVGEEPDRKEYTLMLGGIDPVSTISGIQGRLKNLGLDCGAVDNQLGPRTRRALREFQGRHGLPETGQPDQGTRNKLRQLHGA
jgi:N-acetylmuramoyl-L-alanine amidase